MIKVRILHPFKDKHTGKVYEKGATVDMTAKRINEIIRSNPSFIELVETAVAEKKTENK